MSYPNWTYYYYYYYYYFGVCCARPGDSEDTLSVQRPQPNTTNPWKEERDKTVGDKKERADRANRKALALLLKPASPTPSNTGSLRSFQRDTERGTKLLRYLFTSTGSLECYTLLVSNIYAYLVRLCKAFT